MNDADSDSDSDPDYLFSSFILVTPSGRLAVLPSSLSPLTPAVPRAVFLR